MILKTRELQFIYFIRFPLILLFFVVKLHKFDIRYNFDLRSRIDMRFFLTK